jgi:hypothetical protein
MPVRPGEERHRWSRMEVRAKSVVRRGGGGDRRVAPARAVAHGPRSSRRRRQRPVDTLRRQRRPTRRRERSAAMPFTRAPRRSGATRRRRRSPPRRSSERNSPRPGAGRRCAPDQCRGVVIASPSGAFTAAPTRRRSNTIATAGSRGHHRSQIRECEPEVPNCPGMNQHPKRATPCLPRPGSGQITAASTGARRHRVETRSPRPRGGMNICSVST